MIRSVCASVSEARPVPPPPFAVVAQPCRLTRRCHVSRRNAGLVPVVNHQPVTTSTGMPCLRASSIMRHDGSFHPHRGQREYPLRHRWLHCSQRFSVDPRLDKPHPRLIRVTVGIKYTQVKIGELLFAAEGDDRYAQCFRRSDCGNQLQVAMMGSGSVSRSRLP